jgi:hypothetical protein
MVRRTDTLLIFLYTIHDYCASLFARFKIIAFYFTWLLFVYVVKHLIE